MKRHLPSALLALAFVACQSPASEPQDPTALNAVEDPTPPGKRPMHPGERLCQDGVTYVVSSDPKLPLLRYQDGQISQNDSCAVLTGNRLNRRIPPAYVNGQPLGFC